MTDHTGERGTLRPSEPQLAAVQAVILDALRARWGDDNADPYEDDPTTIGVSLLDGSFVELTMHLCVHPPTSLSGSSEAQP